MFKCRILLKPVLGGVDGNLHFPVPSMNRLNQTEPATFSILPCWAFFRDSVFISFLWGHLKDNVYNRKSDTLEQLKSAIHREIRKITPAKCVNAIENFNIVVTCLSVWEKCPVCQCVCSVVCYCVSPCMCLNNIRCVSSTICVCLYVLFGVPGVLWVSVCYCLSCVLCVGACHFLCLSSAMCVSVSVVCCVCHYVSSILCVIVSVVYCASVVQYVSVCEWCHVCY
jgi:hypothetical protein